MPNFVRTAAASTLGLSVGVLSLGVHASSAEGATSVTNVSASLTSAGYGVTYGALPTGINASGQVVGLYHSSSASGTDVPFVFTPGTGPKSGVVALTQVTPYFQTQAAAINNSGVVVGAGTVNGDVNGFVYNTATSTFTGLTAASVTGNGTNTVTKTSLNAINNSGLAVGYIGYDGTNVGTRAYRGLSYNTTSGTGKDVGSAFAGPVVSGNSTTNEDVIGGINDSGVIAGYGPNTGGVGGTGTVNNTQIFYRAVPTGSSSYTYTDLTPAIRTTVGTDYAGVAGAYLGVDALGNVAGTYKSILGTTNATGFLYNASAGTVVALDFGAQHRSYVYALGDVGGQVVVGGQLLGTGGTNPSKAFLFQAGLMSDISGALAGTTYSNYLLTNVNGINANGDVVVTGSVGGTGIPTIFVLNGFVVPEPASLGLLGLGAIALLRRRNRHCY